MKEKAKKTSRRKFLRRGFLGALGACAALGAYPFVEARFFVVTRRRIGVPGLPKAFAGTTVALLTDIHHGPYYGMGHVRSIVEKANELGADLIALGGDYVHRDAKYIEPCIAGLGKLKAKKGVFAVLGNHDHWESAPKTRAALEKAGIPEFDSSGVWLEKHGERLRFCGVDDLWEGVTDLNAALADCGEDEAAILLTHNPDLAEGIRDRRVKLVLSGHTHGGQVDIPFMGPPFIPSRYGDKYAEGLVKTGHTQVYVSRGLGTISPPVRFNCRPEMALLTLEAI
ncbi:MAG: metallophosphoesterase [Pseudomonadota bacterium]